MMSAVDQKQVAKMARNYPGQAGWLAGGLPSTLDQIDHVLALLSANERDQAARRLLRLRDRIAVELALFDAIRAKEKELCQPVL
jgi:hypothetical protein